MSVTSMASFKGDKEKEKNKAYKRWKRTRARYLGGRVYYALTRQHHCDRCIFPIDYLEQYLLERYVRDYYDENGKKLRPYFWYERSHWPSCYGPSEDEEREIREQMERERALEEKQNKKKAA